MISNCHTKTILCIMMSSYSANKANLPCKGGLVQFPKVSLHSNISLPDSSQTLLIAFHKYLHTVKILYLKILYCQNTLTIYCIVLRPYLQGVSRLYGIIAGGDFLGLCDQKNSHKHVSDFGRLRSYDRLKLRIEGNDY